MAAERASLIRAVSGGDGIPNIHTFWDGRNHHVDDCYQQDFWRTYCDLAYHDEEEDSAKTNNKVDIDIGEMPGRNTPIIANLCMQFSYIEGFDYSSIYDHRFVIYVTKIYQKAIREYIHLTEVEVNEFQKELVCCVLEPNEGIVRNGFFEIKIRLQFPYCCTSPVVQKRYIRQYVIQNLKMDNVISLLKSTPSNKWEQIIDGQTPETPLPLYRSTQSKTDSKLMMTAIYGEITDEDIAMGDAPPLQLENIFNPANHSHVQQSLVESSMFEEQNDIRYWLPVILSTHYWSTVSPAKPQRQARMTRLNVIDNLAYENDDNNKFMDFDPEEEIRNPLKMAEDLLEMIAPSRWREQTWIDLGKAIYNSAKASGELEEGANIWYDYVRRHNEGFRMQNLKTTWNRFRRNNCLSVKTIGWYARIDGKTKYKRWHKEWCKASMMKALSCSHFDVAIAFKRCYWLDFICSRIDGANMRIYEFREDRWNILDGGNSMIKRIQIDFKRKYEILQAELSNRIAMPGTNQRDKKEMQDTLLDFVKLIGKKLTDSTYVSKIKKTCAVYFHSEDFDKNADRNPNLMGILNGVIETTSTGAVWRPGKPEDFVTMCSAVYYDPDYTWEHEDIQWVMKWMRECFPGKMLLDQDGDVMYDPHSSLKLRDQTLMNYGLKLFSSTLRSRNSDKIFPILTGVGNNSKSMIKKAMEAIFGPYCVNLPTSALTKHSGKSSNASPEFARMAYAKQVWTQETDDDESLRNGPIKMLVGGDTFYARALHDNGGDQQATFILFLMCNKVPQIPSCDKAVKNRVRIVPFLGTWTTKDEAPSDYEQQLDEFVYPMDPFFEDKIPDMAPAFLWVLVQYYEIYRREGLGEPVAVKEETDKYWSSNDMYRLFTKECIQTAIVPGTKTVDNPNGDQDANAVMTVSQVYDDFKSWYKEFYPGQKDIPSRDRVDNQLTLRWGPRDVSDGCWHGIQSANAMMAMC